MEPGLIYGASFNILMFLIQYNNLLLELNIFTILHSQGFINIFFMLEKKVI